MLRLLLASMALAFVTLPGVAAADDDSCQYANDLECDEARYGGGGYCADGTDMTDCAVIASGMLNDSCQWANDGMCDEPRYGGFNCTDGTDTTDCRTAAAGVAGTLNGMSDDSCHWANDGECDDPTLGGTGACAPGTDATDCASAAGQGGPAITPQVQGFGNDSCIWANDGECDDATLGGTGACEPGTDATDCAAAAGQGGPAIMPQVQGFGNDSCMWANDGECDDATLGGTGACEPGTDATDCAAAAGQQSGSSAIPQVPFAQLQGDDSCQWANDGECDEARFGGGGYCLSGTDATDCAAIAATAQCEWAFDFECDEARYGGGGYCPDGTDTFDCAVLATGVNDDSCVWANDGECDEPRYGGANCRDGSDTTDCRIQAGGADGKPVKPMSITN